LNKDRKELLERRGKGKTKNKNKYQAKDVNMAGVE
jgi:hypothetical protein